MSVNLCACRSQHKRLVDPNRRQQLALERIDFAVGELASVLLSSCRSGDIARAAVRDIRKAMTPIVADILEVE